MSGVRTDPLILEIIGKTDQLEREVKRARAHFSTETQQMQRASASLRQQLQSDSAAGAATLRRLAGALGAYFSGRELAGIIDSFTQFQNKLRVAGVAASDLGAVQDRLFASAQRYGVELGTLGQLFGSLSSASKEMGASQEQVFELTEAVSAALKVSGTSATEASGAMLQLGQALRGGKIQAEEFNSLLDGLYPLLEAAAAGSSRFGGSVGELTRQVKEGKVASSELFAAILAGSDDLQKRAATATLTLSGAYTQLSNALSVYVGQAAQTSGVQAALTNGITAIAENLDDLIPALAIVAAAMGVRYVASAGAAAIASIRAEAALVGLTTRAEIAGFAFGALAKSLAINGAVLALTAAIAAFASEAATTSSLIQQANTQFDEMRRRLDATTAGAGAAESGARGVGAGAAAAEPQVRSFAGAVGALADQLYRQAQAARAAKVEMLGKRLADSQSAEVEIGKRTGAGRSASASEFRRGDFLNNVSVLGRAIFGGTRNTLSGGRSDREAAAALGKQVEVSKDLQRQLREAQAAPLTSYVPSSLAAPAPGGSTGGSRRAGGGGRAGGQSADQRREEQQRIASEIANAQLSYLQELAQTTQNASERADLEKRVIEATRVANEREIANNEALDATQRAKLLEINGQVASLRVQQVQDREAERLRAQQLELTSRALRDQDEYLRLQLDLADTAGERRVIELRRVDIAYRLEEAALAEELAQAEIAKDTQRIAAVRKQMAAMAERRGLDTESVTRSTEGPAERYVREVNRTAAQISEDIDNAAVMGLDRLNDSLADVITGVESLGDVFSNVAKQIIADLARIAIRKSIIEPLAGMLFGGSAAIAGGASSTASGLGSSIAKGLFGRASGGYMPPNSVRRVNEGSGRVELLRMGPQGGEVIPLGQTRAAVPQAASREPITIQLVTRKGEAFDTEVLSVSGPAIVQYVDAVRPGITREAMVSTVAEIGRRRL